MVQSFQQARNARPYTSRTAAITVDGKTVPFLESFGYDQSKDHSLEHTLDKKAVWNKSPAEFSGTFTMKDPSPAQARLEHVFLRDIVFDIQMKLANVYGNRVDPRPRFLDCMMTDFSRSDYEIGEVSTISAEWSAVNKDVQTGGR